MKLKALDQIHISSVRAETIRTSDVFEVSDSFGAELIARHPRLFMVVSEADGAGGEKAEPAPANKAEKAPPNKAAPRPKTKAAPPEKADPDPASPATETAPAADQP